MINARAFSRIPGAAGNDSGTIPLRRPPGRYPQHGIALVMVLWLLVLMTVIASSHSRNIRTETQLAFNHIESTKARSLAEAGVYHAIIELLVADDRQRWTVNGETHRVRFTEGNAAISIHDTRGLIDLNSVRSGVLDTVLQAAGIADEEQRLALVDATLDWRDGDSLKHLRGAEDDDYRIAGLGWAARDGDFASIEEFRYVMGMTNTLFARLEPYLTIHSGQAGVNADFAPPWLAAALNGGQAGLSTGNATGSIGGATYRVTAQATTPGGTTTTLEAVVRIAPENDKPYKILSWRTPARSPNREPAGAA